MAVVIIGGREFEVITVANGQIRATNDGICSYFEKQVDYDNFVTYMNEMADNEKEN